MAELLKEGEMFENFTNRAENWLEPKNRLPLGLGILAAGSLFFFLGRRRGLTAGISRPFWLRNRFFGRFSHKLEGKTASDLMSENPAFCRRNTPLQEVARLMVDFECGVIPVVDEGKKPIGVVTDRDIVCRTMSKGQNTLNIPAEKVMTTPVTTVQITDDARTSIELLEENEIRRIPVVDQTGVLVGIISHADVIRFLGLGHKGQFIVESQKVRSTEHRFSAA